MRIIGRKKLDRPIMMAAGDRLTMSYVEIDGVVRTERTTVFALIIPWRAITVDEAVLFETKIEGTYAVGGLVIERRQQ